MRSASIVATNKNFPQLENFRLIDTFADTFSSLKTLLPKFQINFEHLWTLYPPNTIVWTVGELGQFQAYKVRSAFQAKDANGFPWLVLSSDYIDSNGKDVGWVSGHQLKLPWFDGVKDILSLSYIPLEMGPEPEKMKAQLIENGKAAMKRHGRQLVEYQGPGLYKRKDCWARFNGHGRVMLDPETWELTHPGANGVPSINTISRKSLENDEKMLSVNSLVYGKFSVPKTKEADWNDQAFEMLVLDENLKTFVQDLVCAHRAGDDGCFDDFVRDKGKSLIGLLAGAPGVGKTLTAEAIAEVSRRPLYTISSGELGYEPTTIHQQLKTILELAELWDAVVLLDEADVFLTARDESNLKRNAIVSVFLRELEYYRGIIILTTNRATIIDSAFQSRIHFSLQYHDLDNDSRMTIWRNFLDRARKNVKLEVKIDDDGLVELAQMQLNGRQIKNALSVGQAVALRRKEALTVQTLKAALSLSQ